MPRLKNDICYLNGLHFGNNACQKFSGRPIVQFFVDESEYGNLPKTGAAPSWPDVSASVNGSTVNWQLHAGSSAASTTTISGFQVYASTDGGNSCQPVGAEQPGNATSESLAGLPAGRRS